MSNLVYCRTAGSLTLFDRDGAEVGVWTAGNNVDSRVGLPHLPLGVYRFKRHAHLRHGAAHGDASAGKFGPMGIFLLEDFPYRGKWHSGVGIHSGRKNVPDGRGRQGPEHATELCVRTTDVAMSMIHLTEMEDPLQTLTIRN